MSFLHGLIIITITIQLITTQETHTTNQFQQLNSTDSPLNINELEGTTSTSISGGNEKCYKNNNTTSLTQLQLVLLEEASIRVALTEIEEGNLEFLWDFLKNLNPAGEPLMEKIIKRSVEKYFRKASILYYGTAGIAELNSCFDSGFLKLLKFVNQSPNASWKLVGYQTLFNEITFNTTTSQKISLFLNLQHYISQDESIITDADFQTLLHNTESSIDDLIQSFKPKPSFFDCGPPMVHFDYLIKRICLTYPNKIAQLWNELSERYSMELLLQFVMELETNNRMNYTSLAIPQIKNELQF
ncbi:uncharacterized protein LOC119073714 [Bradysia coprophila]|uniref:uncharacterized protein LOC119073714 n=1 Tax=Bradysia coprophila TaxID=38358 RepID=UPI00187DD26D|nr:uncharacterized protein LOC119073714 [Bradysia coprophila]